MLATDAATLLPKAQALMTKMQASNMELKNEIKRFKTLNLVLQQAIDSQLQSLPELQFADSTAAPATRLAQACGALKTRAQELEHQIDEKRQRKLRMQRELEEKKAKLKSVSLSTTPAKLIGSPLKLSPSSGTGSGISNISRKEAALLLQQDLFRKRFLLRRGAECQTCHWLLENTAFCMCSSTKRQSGNHVLPIIDPEELQRLGSWARVLQMKRQKGEFGVLEEILDKMAANFEHRLEPGSAHFREFGEPGKQECGLVVRSVGFDILPFQVEPPSDNLGGLYVSGWVKRGPQGIIASNIGDAQDLSLLADLGSTNRSHSDTLNNTCEETATKVVMDTQGKPAKAWSTDPVVGALTESGSRVVEFRDWQTLEAEDSLHIVTRLLLSRVSEIGGCVTVNSKAIHYQELRRGQETGKAAAKFTSVPDMQQPKTLSNVFSATIPRAGVARLIAEGGDGVTPETADPDQSFVRIGWQKKAVQASYIAAVPPADVEMTDADKGAAKEVEIKFPQLSKPYAPELEAFAVLILVVKLSDKRDDKHKAMEVASAMVLWLKTLNRRTLDLFNARAYFYLSLAYERCGRLSEIRPELLAAYRSACLRHDQMGQATLLNLLLRNYLAYNLYDQALKLVSKTSFPESRPNMQYARYLFYIGQIKAVQLEYSDSHSKLMQAIRKAPQTPDVALGFKLAASKLAIVVELLMGGVPERSFFTQKELKEHLRPYYAITQAVRSGDLHAFKECTKTYEALFKKDKTLTLINRLRYNVIKTGLRSICLAYSRISLQDICTKLGLESPQDAAGVVAKAVVDGVIDATIDYDQQFVKSNQKIDLYHSCEPQKALHKRIAFCLQMHNDAVKAMAYPDENDNKDAEDPEEKREREKRELANIEEDGGDDDMMYFTLDFDRQIFYYAHSESRKSQVSKPIHFRDILGAHAGHSYEPDDLGCPGQAKVTRSLSGVLSRPRPPAPGIFPFTVRTRGKRLRLEAEVEAEVFQWIAMLNAAHRIGEDVDLLSSSTWLPDAPTASPSSRSPRSEAGKAPSVTSIEASQMSTTADADENYSELGMPSPHSKAWSETGCEELDVGEDAALGMVAPCSCRILPPQAVGSSTVVRLLHSLHIKIIQQLLSTGQQDTSHAVPE
ncbi:Rpn3 [Symbiodinium sp. CCMP2456]|nr:Rpn3 [Symbiodinium sp. CCMP2456]